MSQRKTPTAIDAFLHAAEVGALERRIMDLALARTGARHGAIFLWDKDADGLAIDFHVVDGVEVTIPGMVLKRRAGRANGIALHVLDTNEPYLSRDTAQDPLYAPYFLDVRSVAAAPIPYQGRAVGVISVSSLAPDAFDERRLAALVEVAESSATFLRRAQLFRAERRDHRRPMLIKGLSRQWLEVERQVEQVSPTTAPVLIQGESGTGKELLAHAIHFNSLRADGPLVSVNCAAIPESLLESTLFGHVKGAFTGASFTKVGELQKAHGGTLFLDEVGELPLLLQAKLLRAVETGEILPLGSNAAPVSVDIRLVSATHRDLATMVEDGLFRDDLYYRIGVVTLSVPALRTYKDNLPLLARVYLLQSARQHEKAVAGISPQALSRLLDHDFPGNVRELRNVIEHAVIMARGATIELDDLPGTLRDEAGDGAWAESTSSAAPPSRRATVPAPPPPPDRPRPLAEMREEWLAPVERDYLVDLLRRTDGNVRLAAELAAINVVTMYRLLKKRGIGLRRSFREDEPSDE